MRVTAKERDQIVTAYTTVQKKHPSWRMVVVSSRGFAEDSRKTLETNGIECKTYQDLLRELLPLENYIRGQVSDYENWFNDKEKGWGGRDLFIRPDVRRESTNEEKKALDLFAEWIADSNQNHLTILGDLGTGKSTLTRFLAYQMGLAFLEDQARHPAPVFIPLREAKRAAFDLETIIISHFNKNGIPDVKFSNFEHLLNSGKIILFFDAFDEMADRIRWEETRQNFQELNRAISKNDKVILTCRTHYFKSREEQIEILGKGPGYSEAVTELYKDLAGQPGRTIVDLCEFTDDQIKEYVKKARPETFQEDIKKIEDIYDLHELAHRPLLLDMIVKSLHKIGEDSKINAADLYTVYTDIWIQREELKHPTLKPDVKLNLMLELAWRMWDLERSEISIDEMIPLVEDLLRKGFIDIVDEEARDIVREMHTATFLRRGKNDAFIFVHRSFMEYFLARKICQTLGVINESGNALKENIQQTDESLKILKTNRLEQKIVYFIAHVAKNDLLKEPLNEILTNAYREKISENALQILYWTGRVRCKAEKKIPDAGKLIKELEKRIPESAQLPGAELDEMVLECVPLRNANLNGAKLSSVNFNNSDLRGSDFSGDDLGDSKFFFALLSYVKFNYAMLQGSHFVEAVFKETDFSNAVIDDVVFEKEQVDQAIGLKKKIDIKVNVKTKKLEVNPIVQLGHSGGVNCVSYSFDGEFLATGGDEGNIKIWKSSDGRLIRTLKGHDYSVWGVAFSPDGKTIASASSDGSVRLWSSKEGKEICAGYFIAEGVWLIVLPDGRFIASPQGMRYLCYTEKEDLRSYTAEELAKTFYKPDEVRDEISKYLGNKL